jgi:two-component system sensor histidine kinase QseC
MKSIRTYLLLALIAIITLVIFVSLLQGYRSSMNEAAIVFDNRLQSMAENIASANQDVSPRTTPKLKHSSHLFFQIWDDDLQLISHSVGGPDKLYSELASKQQFKDINIAPYRWRTFTLRDENLHRWIVMAERLDIRYSLAEDVVLASIVPIVLAIPIAAFIIWIAIGIGLKPLNELALQLSEKKAEDLSPVTLQNEPEELSQLVTTTNALFSRLEEAFQREQQFSADAAHELRTPISILKVQLHNLRADSPDQSALEPLAQGIDRMGQVIEQILSLYRHSPEQMLQTQQLVDLFLITQQLIANNYDQFSNKNQQISLSGDAGYTVEGNQFALETLVQNLISNACKYTPELGEIQVTISADSQQLQLIVEDSGPGIPKEFRHSALERFYRVNGDQHSSGIVGCGLGLAIVKQLCDLHGAEIQLDDAIELGGLKVIVTFPHRYV